MGRLSVHEISVLLASGALLLGTAMVLAELARKFHQPAIIGEILAGILLGPTVLGGLWPGAFEALFPQQGPVSVAMHGLTTIAITLFMLVAGLEVDLSTVWRRRNAAIAVAAGGMIVPFVVGLIPALLFPHFMGADSSQHPQLFAVFVATAMSISALPVIAKILRDLQLFRTDLGMTVLAAAVSNDLVGWIIFGLLLALSGHGGASQLLPWQIVALAATFVVTILTFGRLFLDRALPWLQAHTTWPAGVMGAAATLGLLCAAFTDWIGIHAIFGAFLFGVALGDSRHLRTRTRATLDDFISFIFAPLFFASIGLRVNFIAHFDLWLTLTVVVVATVGKVLGCSTLARVAGFGRSEAWSIGFAMNARGAMEIIIGLLALEAGMIGERLFVALVIMALFTSLTSGAVIQALLGRLRSVHFAEFASSRTFVPSMKARSRREAIRELAAAVAPSTPFDADTIDAAAWAREQAVTSGLGGGVAVPHARLEGLSQPVVAIGISRTGIDFDAQDGNHTRLMFLLLTPPQDTKVHVELLAGITRAFRDSSVVNQAADTYTWTHFLAVVRAETDH